jgi:hypothetical protein
MDKPTYEELLAWWRKEQEFYDTPIGRAVCVLRGQAERLHYEHAAYQKIILDREALRPMSPVINAGLK